MRIRYVNLNGHFQDSTGVERNEEEGKLRYSKGLMTTIGASSFKYCWNHFNETKLDLNRSLLRHILWIRQENMKSLMVYKMYER